MSEYRIPIEVSFVPNSGSFDVELTQTTQSINIGFDTEIRLVGGDEYEGEYTVTPSQETQTLPTAGTKLTQNITVNPIPSNYGLITWNGSYLRVS